MKASFVKRIENLEWALAPGDPLPKLFIKICDASMPDPEAPEAGIPDFSDAAIIGVLCGTSREYRISRQSGESWEELQERAGKLSPDTALFMACYQDHESTLERFNNAPELGAQQ